LQPISRPTLVDSAIRYLKDDIIIKSTEENLKKLLNVEFKYPYTLLKVALNNNYEVCNNQACFASVKDINKLEEIII